MTDQGSAHTPNAPVLCTEFGGVNITPSSSQDPSSQDSKEQPQEWGYTTALSPADLLARFSSLCEAVVQTGALISGFVYTQTADVEQETNGLLTPSREPKLPVEDVRAVVERVAGVYLENAGKKAKRREVVFRGGLGDEGCVRGLRVEGGRWLVGECAVGLRGDGEGEWRTSRLDLDACFVNSWGKVTWARGGGFVASCRGVGLVRDGGFDGEAEGRSSTVMEVEAGDGRSWQRNLIRLEERIGNVGGELVFV